MRTTKPNANSQFLNVCHFVALQTIEEHKCLNVNCSKTLHSLTATLTTWIHSTPTQRYPTTHRCIGPGYARRDYSGTLGFELHRLSVASAVRLLASSLGEVVGNCKMWTSAYVVLREETKWCKIKGTRSPACCASPFPRKVSIQEVPSLSVKIQRRSFIPQ